VTSGEVAVARRVLEALAGVGVRHVFGLPGVHNLAFWRETGADLPVIIGVRHEQTAVYAADGLARASGGLGAALTTTGPGAANAVGAFGEAASSGSPVLMVASEISTRLARPGVMRGVLHESRDQAAIFEPLAKAVFRPRTPDDVISDTGAAIAAALSFPRGPVYLDIPTDLLDAPAGAVSVELTAPPAPDPADVERLVELIAAADDIVLWVGGGAVQSGAAEQVRVLAERLQASVVTTFRAHGILPAGHPCLVGIPPHEREVADLIGAADLMIGLGSDFDGPMTRNWTMPMPRALAAINCDVDELTKNYPIDAGVVGDVRLTLQALLKALPDVEPAQRSAAATVGARARARLAGEPDGAAAIRLLDSIEAVIGPNTVVLADMAIPGYWVAGYGAFSAPRRLQYALGWGTLGYALPASLGPATLGEPVLVVCGDGGFMFAVGELSAIVQAQLPVVVLLVDDGGYGMLRFDQVHAGDAVSGVELARPDFAVLAQAFGVEVERVSDTGQPLADALRRALASGQPRLVVLDAALTPPRTTSPRWHEE
jgi:thiamine pyrophosphate-dependent acetolactate synthase large subunit-like protein